MSEAKTFKCPSCGSALEPDGDEKEIKCAFCGSTVIVPEELRDQPRIVLGTGIVSMQTETINPEMLKDQDAKIDLAMDMVKQKIANGRLDPKVLELLEKAKEERQRQAKGKNQ